MSGISFGGRAWYRLTDDERREFLLAFHASRGDIHDANGVSSVSRGDISGPHGVTTGVAHRTVIEPSITTTQGDHRGSSALDVLHALSRGYALAGDRSPVEAQRTELLLDAYSLQLAAEMYVLGEYDTGTAWSIADAAAGRLARITRELGT